MKQKTITYDELYDKITKFIKNENDLDLINKAYELAKEKHKTRIRKNGEEYITHPLYVAEILVEQNVDAETIAAALLHETMNHANTTYEEIVEKTNEEVAKIVLMASKINRLELADEKESSSYYLRKVLVGMAEDVRVLILKLADRLHNMRTAYALSEEEQKRKATETMNVLIPIAHRLGINGIKSELEELSLKYLEPEKYREIEQKLNATKEEMNELLNEMKEEISDILSEHDIAFTLKGRVKSIYSIYRKLEKGRKWSDIYDILALRVYVEKESDCYLAVGLIHAKFRPIPNRFKDYIAIPKANMYQSLHTTVFGIDGNLFEIQIRTYEMDEIAEKGIASHWSYKEKGTVKIQHAMEQKLEMFRNLIDASNNETTSDSEFEQTVNKEILSDSIFCFTPKGDVVELPNDSTPLDFAYRIHSKVGEHTTGAIVNDSIVTLDYKLQDGDIIKILTNASSSPKKDWLKIVTTSQAKNKIKAFFSKKDREVYIEKGKILLEKDLKKAKITLNDFYNDDVIEKILKDLKLNELDEIYFGIGSLRYTSSYIIELIKEDKKNLTDLFLKKVNSSKSLHKNYNKDILVSNYDDILVSIAQCCKPVKGDKIVGYISKGKGIIVHKQDCKCISDSKKLIDVTWNMENESNYITEIKITVDLGKNYLLNILTVASTKNIYFDSIKTTENDVAITYQINVKVKSIEELNSFLNELNRLKYVRIAERV